mgnify:CR=1 FL=1
MAKNENAKSTRTERRERVGIRQWVYGILASVCCVLFSIWTGYYAVLIMIPVFIDIYITKYVNWSGWKNAKNPHVRKMLEWVDAILFALIGVYIITTFFCQNYQIPTSSLEKSLLVGDFLCVNKMSYGTRSPMTPFSFPLVQSNFPIIGTKSYLEKPQLEYKRFPGLGKVKRHDIVVFNYPSGDTVAMKQTNRDYYIMIKEYGRSQVENNENQFGEIAYRPVDRRDNYVKRCMGLPGEIIEMRNDSTFIDGQLVHDAENMQLVYAVQTEGTALTATLLDELGISMEDRRDIGSDELPTDSLTIARLGLENVNNNGGFLYTNVPLTKEKIEKLSKKPYVKKIIKYNEFLKRKGEVGGVKYYQPSIYPIDYERYCMPGDYPATWIPAKGATLKFDTDIDYKVAAYRRCIKNYEGNEFEYKDGKVYINGQQADSYTFKYDYYFMMGDNRDKSLDSRMWGFVPEDHIIGQPMVVWLSLDKDKGWFDGKIRWNRLFTKGNKQ